MRRDEQRLSDILEALDWIAKAVSDGTEDDFVTDETLGYAVHKGSRQWEKRSRG